MGGGYFGPVLPDTSRPGSPTALSGQHLEVLVEDGDLKDLLTLPQLIEAAPFLTERWIRRLVSRGDLPHYRLGGRLLFDLGEVQEAVRKGRAAG